MSNVLDSLSKAVSRFVIGWLLPSLVTVTIYLLVVLPSVKVVVSHNQVTIGLVIGLSTLTVGTLFAYTSLPVYRLLEGYTMPRRYADRLRSKRHRELLTINRLRQRSDAARLEAFGLLEKRQYYPEKYSDLQPTRLGNALRALEAYGADRFGLDSQTLWYELLAVCPPPLRQELDESRASIDWFISALAHLALLAVATTGAMLATGRWPVAPIVTVLLAVLLLRPSYNSAVRNVLEWRYAVQALVNVGRGDLARKFSLELPRTHEDECEMWNALTWYVIDGDPFLMSSVVDEHRVSARRPLSTNGQTAVGGDATLDVPVSAPEG